MFKRADLVTIGEQRTVESIALFMQYLPNGKAEVLRPNGKIEFCSAAKLRLWLTQRDLYYARLVDCFWPNLSEAA